MRARTLASASSLVLALAACGGDDGGSTADAGVDAPLGDPTILTGSVDVVLVDADPKYTTINAVVSDGAKPVLPILDTMTTDGDCRLLIPAYPFCTTSCGTGVCVADETCMPYPTSQDVGTIHVTGVHTAAGASELDLTHIVGSNGAHSYQQGATTLAYPGFAEGDPITAAISGGTFTPPFTMSSTGIAPLVVTSAPPTIDRNTPVTVTWTPPASGATSRILVKVEISHHGGFRGQVECDTADDGSLTLGGPLLTQLLDLGVAGFPTIETERKVVSSGLTTAGRVELTVSSAIAQAVTIPGVISCTDDTECTPPATCQDDLTCR
ncbi:MAG: hypothetical protein JNK64_06475 [Myxococcales bacterium]|nr:hypothetical protein [Myxococcales bacterium]